MLNAARCCAAQAERQNPRPVSLCTIELTSKWCKFKFNWSHFNARIALWHLCSCSNINLDNFTVISGIDIGFFLDCSECEWNLSECISMSVVVARGGSVDGLSQSVCYLHKAGRTAGTLRPGARYRPLWLRSLQRGERIKAGEPVRCLIRPNQFTHRAAPKQPSSCGPSTF